MMPPLINTLTSAFDNNTVVLMDLIIVVTVFTVIVVFVAIFWLGWQYLRLKQEIFLLSSEVESNKNDIFGLCSAALNVNENGVIAREQLQDLKQQVAHLLEKVSHLQQGNAVSGPYQVDITKIREGATVDELMLQSNLSYDEAALLVRLHGGKKH